MARSTRSRSRPSARWPSSPAATRQRSYAGESAYQPILSHLIRELGLDLSILHGQIDEI
ncbi:NIL domain-containing protein, partial [Escherichia coli]|uniref:NIL domain-containing protein n=1 Tax=Escherichia coli TaxID=562 RepID=UPI000BD78F73